MSAPLDILADFWTPHPGQREFLLADSRYRVLACGRRWGKTDACAAALILGLFDTGPTRQLILAPTLAQAEILFDRVVEFVEHFWPEEAKVRRSRFPSLTLGPHRIWARSGHVPRSLRGQGATHIVVDEAAFVRPELITDIALPMLATTHGRLTLLSTPWGRNHFWRFYVRGLEGEENFWSRHAPSAESPWVRPEFLAVQRELLSERAFAVEYEAAFLDAVNQVFQTEAIEAAIVPHLPPAPIPYRIGVDFGRYTDYTSVAVLAGDHPNVQLAHIEKFNGGSWKEQVERIARIVSRFPNAQVLCDGTGNGDAAVEMLQGELTNQVVSGLVFTASVKRELVEHLAVAFERRAFKMLPNPDLIRELSHFEAQLRPTGNTRFTSPSGYHDDMVIALALAYRLLPKPYRAQVIAAGSRQFSHVQPQNI